jgi:hypothetical protein
MEAHQKARTLFSSNREPEFVPHLSLMYGNFSWEIKEKIIAEIGKDFYIRFEVKDMYVTCVHPISPSKTGADSHNSLFKER